MATHNPPPLDSVQPEGQRCSLNTCSELADVGIGKFCGGALYFCFEHFRGFAADVCTQWGLEQWRNMGLGKDVAPDHIPDANEMVGQATPGVYDVTLPGGG